MSQFGSDKDLRYLRFCDYGAKLFSTCAKRQYLAIILGENGRTVGTGYNGSPPGIGHCVDGACPRMQEGSKPGSTYDNCISIHAEENALMWSNRTDRERGTLYVNGAPCYGCAKKMAGSGLARVVIIEDPTYEDWKRGATMMRDAGLAVVSYTMEDVVANDLSAVG